MGAIYPTQPQRMFIQRPGENAREDEISIDASSYMVRLVLSAKDLMTLIYATPVLVSGTEKQVASTQVRLGAVNPK